SCEFYTLSLHDALPIFGCAFSEDEVAGQQAGDGLVFGVLRKQYRVLQEDRHTDRGDQRDESVAATQGAVGHPFDAVTVGAGDDRSEEHTSELQSRENLV